MNDKLIHLMKITYEAHRRERIPYNNESHIAYQRFKKTMKLQTNSPAAVGR